MVLALGIINKLQGQEKTCNKHMMKTDRHIQYEGTCTLEAIKHRVQFKGVKKCSCLSYSGETSRNNINHKSVVITLIKKPGGPHVCTYPIWYCLVQSYEPWSIGQITIHLIMCGLRLMSVSFWPSRWGCMVLNALEKAKNIVLCGGDREEHLQQQF